MEEKRRWIERIRKNFQRTEKCDRRRLIIEIKRKCSLSYQKMRLRLSDERRKGDWWERQIADFSFEAFKKTKNDKEDY